jgi:hypothetical protein
LKFDEADIAMRQKQRELASKVGIIFEQAPEKVTEVTAEEVPAGTPSKLYEP